MCDDEQVPLLEGSEFHTEETATLKPREAEVVWSQGTDIRLVLKERKERAEMC